MCFLFKDFLLGPYSRIFVECVLLIQGLTGTMSFLFKDFCWDPVLFIQEHFKCFMLRVRVFIQRGY